MKRAKSSILASFLLGATLGGAGCFITLLGIKHPKTLYREGEEVIC